MSETRGAGLRVALDCLWNGRAAPGVGGEAWLELDRRRLLLGWRLQLVTAPRLPPAAAAYYDGLWEYDVVELFLAGSTGRYLELEFGPAGHWLALGFERVRRRGGELRRPAPELVNRLERGAWSGTASCAWEPLERWIGGPPQRLLLAAVLGSRELDAGPHHLSWPRLPGARPDYHQPQAWASWGADG